LSSEGARSRSRPTQEGPNGVLDSAELRASYDLVDDAALQASADAKMNELGAREAEGYVQAMQLEM